MAKSKALICPYCGETQPLTERCRACGGLFEPLSRQATHNEMGPWYIRDVNRPFQPGCSYETLIKLIERGQVNKFTILRGPTTKQFWTIARRVPGVSHLLGYCHNCDASVDVGDHGCHACGVPFGAYLDRNYLGLPEIRPLPWEASHEDEERGQDAGSRMIDFRRAAEPLGISSFASDEELRSGGLPPHPAPFPISSALSTSGSTSSVASTVGTAPAATAPSPGFGDARLAVNSGFIPAQPEPAPSANAALASAREVARQRRRVRMLTVALIVTFLIAVAAIIVLIIRTPTSGEGSGSGAEIRSASPKTQPEPATPPSVDQAAQAAPQEEPPPVAPQPAIDVESLLNQAQEQLAIGEDETNSIEQRIAAYEEALRLLKQIDAVAAADRKPEDLADRIKAVERSLDDLRLKAYFP